MKRKLTMQEKRRRLMAATLRQFDPVTGGDRYTQMHRILSKWCVMYRDAMDRGELVPLTLADITAEVEPEQKRFHELYQYFHERFPDIPEAELIFCTGATLNAPSRRGNKPSP